ncbi:winged helix DNA-binding protein [Streptomyces sp. NBC_00536]|uniref:hypothetical protein n=1 Tax=Streptomyces sp. NBC_00536 TaxID=2975769 RepID=UPI002E81B794|nr:hypothetical protein [Streptomyces sp. NBC_00536]WUC76952.1 winged helix DNA-binding protein [Streptomyces sp. NBC_00536]
MPQPESADPFSTFLNTADRARAGRSDGSSAQSPSAQSPDAVTGKGLRLLRLLAERGPMRLEDVRRVLGLSTLDIAQELVRLTERELVALRTDGADDIVELTERGAGFTEAT